MDSMPARRNRNMQRGSGKHREQQTSSSKEKKEQLHTFMRVGLKEIQVRERLNRIGPNTIDHRKEIGDLVLLWSQFQSPLIYILIFAAFTTALLGDFADTGVIGLAVVVNTILGFYQERKAHRALAALRALLTLKAVVVREGKRQAIEVSDLVPGDVCFVGLGERIPADGVVVDEEDFTISEAILTGESIPLVKRSARMRELDHEDAELLRERWKGLAREEKVFAGTIVSSGTATLLVVVTGSETEVGKIARSLEETVQEPTPLQKRIARFSNQLAVFVGIAALVIFLTGLLVGESFLSIFTTSVAIAVAAIPEGMAVSLTAILAIGMQRILRRRALVRKLMAAETLGSVTVICADKTGTLTEGVMRVTKAEFVDEEAGIQAAVLVNDQRDPLEIAIWDWVRERKHLDPQQIAEAWERIDAIPFSPAEKYTAKLYDGRVFVMGAPEVVLTFCSMPGSTKHRWMRKFEEYGVRGLRMVGFAMRRRKKGERKLTRKSVKSGLTWIGIVVHEDPVREGVKEALFEVKKAGITVKVITGDHRATAEAVLEQLGLLTKKDKLSARFPLVMEGSELETLSLNELRGRVRETVLFSRIDPVQKLSIVEALQASGEVVAMTGDGVNDAPALKRADVGIVVSGATDVAKETADMVLLDDNFATIAAAVEEGRGIFENLRKVILYLLSDSFSEVTLVMGSLLLGLPLPLTAAQILWINIISDGFPNLALTVEPKEGDLMQQKPRDLREALVNSEIKLLILLISAVTGIVTLIAFYWFWRTSGDVHSARTIAFSMLGVNSLIYVFSARSLRQPLWQTKIFSNPWLLLAVLGGFFFQLAALYAPVFQRLLATRPLTPLEWLLVILQAFLVIGMIESVKWIFLQKRRLREQWDRVLY